MNPPKKDWYTFYHTSSSLKILELNPIHHIIIICLSTPVLIWNTVSDPISALPGMNPPLKHTVKPLLNRQGDYLTSEALEGGSVQRRGAVRNQITRIALYFTPYFAEWIYNLTSQIHKFDTIFITNHIKGAQDSFYGTLVRSTEFLTGEVSLKKFQRLKIINCLYEKWLHYLQVVVMSLKIFCEAFISTCKWNKSK